MQPKHDSFFMFRQDATHLPETSTLSRKTFTSDLKPIEMKFTQDNIITG